MYTYIYIYIYIERERYTHYVCVYLFCFVSASLPFKFCGCSGGEGTPPETLKCLTPNAYSCRRLESNPGPSHPSPTPDHYTIAALLYV